jgi:hypothetical protein
MEVEDLPGLVGQAWDFSVELRPEADEQIRELKASPGDHETGPCGPWR